MGERSEHRQNRGNFLADDLDTRLLVEIVCRSSRDIICMMLIANE